MNTNLLQKQCIITFISLLFSTASVAQVSLRDQVVEAVKETEIARAKAFLRAIPITVTDAYCERSADGKHDFTPRVTTGGRTQIHQAGLISKEMDKQILV